MQNLSWGAVVVTGCFITYVVFLEIASTPSTFFTDSSSLGVYSALVGNVSQSLPNENETNNSSITDYWEKCELPKYDVWDDEMLSYFNPDDNPLEKCDRSFKPLTELKNSSWSVVKPKKGVDCKTRCHERKSERANKISNWTSTPGHVNCEVLEAVCTEDKKEIYGYLHTQVIPKPIERPKVNTTGLKQYDVFVILLDSLSYSQAKRSLPRTLTYFINHLNGVMFPYMNKVGDNSRPNGIALWFGKALEKLDRTLFDQGITPADWTNKYFCNVYKDNETSLFNDFQDYGYRTSLAEDWSEGTMNYPNCVGFNKPPIDHYMRPFQNAYERKNQGAAITQKHLKNGHLCREYHHTLLDYTSQFIHAYPDQKKFGWIWAINLGHNYENGFAHSDKDFHKYMITHRKQLDNSFVFILGDHGLRFGNVRNTFVGALDVNNPITGISIPRDLRKTTKILDILAENAKNIQSHYDTRATILDILKFQSAKNFQETEPSPIPGEKGNSYIRKQPKNPRNCLSLPIPLEYCLCQFNSTNEKTDTQHARKLGETIVEEVNARLSRGNMTDKCIRMEFGKTLSVQKYNYPFKGAILYKVETETKEPSKARFSANIKMIGDEIKVQGMVERTNKYGKTADCIKSEYHRPYCYCKKQPKG